MHSGGALNLYIERWPGEQSGPAVVFLHHGLGSVAQWRDFPRKLTASLGLPGLAYDRIGHGRSPALTAARGPDYLTLEARRLEQFLEAESLSDVILVGHSDGGSIALQCRTPSVRAVITEGAHVFVEDVTRQGIREAVEIYSTLEPRLVRYHGDKTGLLFWEWAGTWLDPRFDDWNMEAEVVRERPVLAIQGREDPYGTTRQLEAIGGTSLLIPHCQHEPHAEAFEPTFRAMRQAILGWL